jgi:thiol-disulfide isomerase/thioredoxin
VSKGNTLRMRKILIPLSFILSSFLFVNYPGLCANVSLSGKGTFKIHEIKAKVILIEIFSLYCPICQSTASAMVELYRQIENHPDFKGKIKLIGIGAGNTESEADAYKQIHNIPFPIFSDEDFSIHRTLGEVRTPFLIVIKVNQDGPQGQDGSHEIVHTHLGGLTDIQGFLDLMYEAYGIPREDLKKRETLATSSASQTPAQE